MQYTIDVREVEQTIVSWLKRLPGHRMYVNSKEMLSFYTAHVACWAHIEDTVALKEFCSRPNLPFYWSHPNHSAPLIQLSNKALSPDEAAAAKKIKYSRRKRRRQSRRPGVVVSPKKRLVIFIILSSYDAE